MSNGFIKFSSVFLFVSCLAACVEKAPPTKESSIDTQLTYVRSSPYYPPPDRPYPYQNKLKK